MQLRRNVSSNLAVSIFVPVPNDAIRRSSPFWDLLISSNRLKLLRHINWRIASSVVHNRHADGVWDQHARRVDVGRDLRLVEERVEAAQAAAPRCTADVLELKDLADHLHHRDVDEPGAEAAVEPRAKETVHAEGTVRPDLEGVGERERVLRASASSGGARRRTRLAFLSDVKSKSPFLIDTVVAPSTNLTSWAAMRESPVTCGSSRMAS